MGFTDTAFDLGASSFGSIRSSVLDFIQSPSIGVFGGGSPVPGANLEIVSWGTWTGVADTLVAYVYRNNEEAAGPFTELGNVWEFQEGDIGAEFFVRVTISNLEAEDTSDSNTITVQSLPPDPPTNLAPPEIQADGGSNFNCVIGTAILYFADASWEGTVDSSLYQWIHNGSPLGEEVETPPPALDTSGFVAGDTVQARVKAVNSGGQSEPVLSNTIIMEDPVL